MSINMKSLTQALAKTAAVIEQTVQSTVHEVTGPKALQDYELQDQVGSGGPGLAWKLFAGKHRNKSAAHNQDVCIWILDKKLLGEARQRVGLSKVAEDAFLDLLRADAAQLVKLRHPGVVHVVQGLEESKGTMTLVTEPLFASVANVLGMLDNVSGVPAGLKGLEIGQLEMKHGLLQVSESLYFLHNNARLIHRSLCPETVFITSSGAWKLGGFSFSISLDQVGNEVPSVPAFHYPEYDTEDLLLPLQPPLNYTAPELTRGGVSFAHTSSDIFSYGCLAYHLLTRQPLFESKNNLKTYTSKVTYMRSEKIPNAPPEFMVDLQRMLSLDELSRPNALELTGSPFFRDDTRLRAIRFLDHMLERDNMQKLDFLKALAGMWTRFDARVLRYKVLPPLCSELRNVIMQPMVLPMVLTIAEAQEKTDFESSTFPSLAPVLASAMGDSLLLLVKHIALLVNKVSADQLLATVVPMLVRAYDDTDTRMQEEVLRRTLPVAKLLDFQVVRQTILPRLHNLALKTTVAAVRVNAILCLGELVPRLDKPSVLEILQTIRRCTAVDHSAPTLMCTLSIATAVYKQYGVEHATEYLLPLLTPLLVAQQLNVQQFAKYMLFIKEILRNLEEKRGVTLNEMDKPKGTVDGYKLAEDVKTKPNADSWEVDDWSSVVNAIPTGLPTKTSSVDSLIGLARTSAQATTIGGSGISGTKPPIFSSLEWPPPMANAVRTPQLQPTSTVTSASAPAADFAKRNGFDGQPFVSANDVEPLDFDPFANWPPPKSMAANMGSSQKPSVLNAQPFSMNGLDASSNKEDIDMGALLTLNVQSGPVARKLAPPPPATGLGKGKGRNPIRPIRSPQADNDPPLSQPPLLDLL